MSCREAGLGLGCTTCKERFVCRLRLFTVHAVFQATGSWESWNVCYHGTKVESVANILKTGQLAKPGDKVLGGVTIGIRDGHYRSPFMRHNDYTGLDEWFDPNAVFFSPSIAYSGCPVYSPTVR